MALDLSMEEADQLGYWLGLFPMLAENSIPDECFCTYSGDVFFRKQKAGETLDAYYREADLARGDAMRGLREARAIGIQPPYGVPLPTGGVKRCGEEQISKEKRRKFGEVGVKSTNGEGGAKSTNGEGGGKSTNGEGGGKSTNGEGGGKSTDGEGGGKSTDREGGGKSTDREEDMVEATNKFSG